MDISADRFISICSGAGGLDLGIERGSDKRAIPICYVENEVTSAAVLAARMEDQRISPAPIWTDINTFDFEAWRGVEGIAGGYPCTPFNFGGARLGAADPRHLWPSIARGIQTIKPIWCFFENVNAHLRYGFSTVAKELHGMGYLVAATLVKASDVGAPHKRERLFILGVQKKIMDDTDWTGRRQKTLGVISSTSRPQRLLDFSVTYPPRPENKEWETVSTHLQPSLSKSELYRMDDGLGYRVDLSRQDRIRIIGNGVIPDQAAYAWRELWRELLW